MALENTIKEDELIQLVFHYDSNKNIIKTCGMKSDPLLKDVVWEQYHYKDKDNSELKAIQAVTLFNPKNLSDLKVRNTGDEEMGYPVWSIEPNNEENNTKELGEVHILSEPELIALSYINVKDEKRKQGIAQTVMSWLALRSYRETKRFYIQDAMHEAIKTIASSIYKQDGLNYETDYGTTYNDKVDAQSLTKNQRINFFMSRMKTESSPEIKRDLTLRLLPEIDRF